MRAQVVSVFGVILAFGCGDAADTNHQSSAGNGAADAGPACLELSGTWTIASHCGAALVGTQVTVTQVGCSVTTAGSFPGFTGDVMHDGSFDLHGTASGMDVACTGTATAQLLTEMCTGNCAVTLTR